MKKQKNILVSTVVVTLLVIVILIYVSVATSDYIKNVETSSSTTTSTTTTTTSTTTTTVTQPNKDSFYKYAKYRSLKAVPADIAKHGKELVLVNNYYELPEDYQWNLVYWSTGEPVNNDILNKDDFNIQAVDAIIYKPLKDMFEAAKNDGVDLGLYSAYRSIVRQNRNFVRDVDNYVNSGYSLEDAKVKTNRSRAYPGTSEHNIGIAVDILEKGSSNLSTSFENTAQFKWLTENAEDYGFILRYPKDKTDVTEIIYEPWHFRYVGVENAKKMNELGYCLEEYIEYLEAEK